MSDERADLRRRLEEVERKTAIWRSQVLVLLLVFVAGWVASAVWMTARLEARVEKTEKVLAERRKTIEAENFVVRDAVGKKWATLGVSGTKEGVANLSFFDDNGVERTRVTPERFDVFTPEKNLAVCLMASEVWSGIFLVNRDGVNSAFSALVTPGYGYQLNSEAPMGRITFPFSYEKAKTAAP